ncbi:MAG: hypothetical protein Ta2E_02450 [Mycoplasmoidaceae bacterium]|nr:MAG: hypothetical protein Ta2E_02450 [Mycoplasmoidaceae bacterium]
MTTEYLIFVDGDDYLETHAVKSYSKKFRINLDLIFCSKYREICSNGKQKIKRTKL